MSDTWASKTVYPTSRGDYPRSVAVDGTVYHFGGISNPTRCDAYDYGTDTWTNKATIPGAGLYRGAAAAIGTTVYLFGGNDMNQVLSYDTVGNSWSVLSDMPRNRKDSQAATHNGKVYIAGGDDGIGNVAAVDVFTPGSAWATVPNLPTPRTFPGVAVLDGILYVVGGRSGTTDLATVESLDLSSPTAWATEASLPAGRQAPATATVAGFVFACGGLSGGLTQNTMYRFDGTTWDTMAVVTNTSRYASAAGATNRFHFLGGNTNVHEVFQAFAAGEQEGWGMLI